MMVIKMGNRMLMQTSYYVVIKRK